MPLTIHCWPAPQKYRGRCLHAFVPGRLAVLTREGVRGKKKGDLGVQHAPPAALREVLSQARMADYERNVFSKADLVEWGLGGFAWDEQKQQVTWKTQEEVTWGHGRRQRKKR